jgi:hypothetical protein
LFKGHFTNFLMRNLLSNLTAALLALHTVLGCCWHHEHRCTEACSLAAAAESPCHCDGPTASSPSHQHHGPHECQGAVCSFVGQIKPLSHDLLSQAVAMPAIDGVEVVLPAGWGRFFVRDALMSSPRLHLVHKVLLI